MKLKWWILSSVYIKVPEESPQPLNKLKFPKSKETPNGKVGMRRGRNDVVEERGA